MSRRLRLISAALALCAICTATTSTPLNAAGTAAPSPPAGAVPLVWPGDARMLSAPLVVGGTVLGEGSLEMVGDTITSTTANFDQAPPDLSLRLFTIVPRTGGGFWAALRFRVPIVVLHSWRGHAVRQTMTVVLTPPSGAAQAVRLQPDGGAVVGTLVAGVFSPSGAGQVVQAGDAVFFAIPASFGAGSDWTVQAIVTVQADGPLHTNRPATGYAAGTSAVPLGMLTGAVASSGRWGVADAITALTSARATPAGTPGLRPIAVRVEGAGAARTAVVTLDGSPLQVRPDDHPHLDLDLSSPGFATLDHPLRITWLPDGAQPVTSAQVFLDAIVVGDVPVSVSGDEVRFELGAFAARNAVATPPTPPLDTMQYTVTLPIGRDEGVRSADGITGAPVSPITAQLTVDGPKITITPASGAPIQGRIDSAGYFTAINATDCYTGTVDQFGNVVVYRTSTSAATTRSGSSAGRVRLMGVQHDSNGLSVDPLPAPSTFRDGLFYKHRDGDPLPRFLSRQRVQVVGGGFPGNFPGQQDFASFSNPNGGPDQPGGAQGGNPDWPNTPTDAATATGGSDTLFVTRVSGGTVPSGRPNDVTTPWVLPIARAGSATATQPVSSSASNASASGGVALPIAIVAAVAVLGAAAAILVRRRRASRTE